MSDNLPIHTAIPLNNRGTYPMTFSRSSEQQNAKDDLFRKKINMQHQNYIENNQLICFGITQHQKAEEKYEMSQKLKRDLEFYNKIEEENVHWRPAEKSTFDPTKSTYRMFARTGLFYLCLRELPIVNPWARATIMYFGVLWWIFGGVGRGLSFTRPMLKQWNNWYDKRLKNFPDLYYLPRGSDVPSHFPKHNASLSWKTHQTPVYHEYHKTTYRYRLRKPRLVPWDGTANQPVMPFVDDELSGVINGTWKLNCNTDPRLR